MDRKRSHDFYALAKRDRLGFVVNPNLSKGLIELAWLMHSNIRRKGAPDEQSRRNRHRLSL
jgi:hypothetical protein